MKKTARILSVLLALVLVVALSATAFAADYTEATANQFKGIPSNAENVTYVTADGSDEDTTPDLVKGWYLYNSEDESWAGSAVPGWDTFAGSSVYVKSTTNYWGINRGEKCESQSGGAKDEKGSYRLKDGVKFYSHLIHVGVGLLGSSDPLEHGIGVKPSAKDKELQNYVLVDVSNHNYFYAITGITGSAFNQNSTNIPEEFGGTGNKGYESNSGANTVIYEIWGSTKAIADTETESKANDDSFKKLASTEIGGTQTGEFNVNVSEYKTLKLVVKVGTKTGALNGTNCVWGEAQVYNLPAGSNSGSSSDDDNAKTADSFAGIVVAMAVLSAGAVVVLTTNRKKF